MREPDSYIEEYGTLRVFICVCRSFFRFENGDKLHSISISKATGREL